LSLCRGGSICISPATKSCDDKQKEPTRKRKAQKEIERDMGYPHPKDYLSKIGGFPLLILNRTK
jgi:hypothetical protein